jgi:branched-chain amino acid transport system ATP-binding protein
MKPLLSVKGLVKRFRGITATDHLDFDVLPGEIHAVIGPNGAGKTTFISQLIGELLPDEGTILFDGVDISRLPVYRRALAGMARSYQITSILPDLTVLQNVMLAVQARRGHGFRFWARAALDQALIAPAREALELVGLGRELDTLARHLGHGACRQLELAVVLAMKPKMLLLDEPMAGMSPQESEEMTQVLLKLKGSVSIVLIEHDLNSVFTLADRITVLVYGRAIATGSIDQVRADPEVQAAYLGDEETLDA